MSRGFGGTFGAGATDSVNPTYTTGASTTAVSIGTWVYMHGTGGFGFGCIMDQSNAASALNISFNAGNISNNLQFTFGWTLSTSQAAVWKFPITYDTWHHVCVTYSASSSSNTPIVYVDGVPVSVTTVTAASGSPISTTAPFFIGNCTGGILNFDGMLSDFAYWNGTMLTAGEAYMLSRGINPLLIRPEGLTMYHPLNGINSPEVDIIRGPTSPITATRLGTSNPPSMDLGRLRSKLYIDTNLPAAFKAAWAIGRNVVSPHAIAS